MATQLADTGEIRRLIISSGRCMPRSSGGCGEEIGAVEDETHYHVWMVTGLCPACQGYRPDHHAPTGCY